MTLRLCSPWFELSVRVGAQVAPHGLVGPCGALYADRPYLYLAQFEDGGKPARRLRYRSHREEQGSDWDRLVLVGELEAGGLVVEHAFTASKSEPWLEEQITLHNSGRRAVALRDLRFGFQRRLRETDRFRILAVPYRRQADGRLRDYAAADLRAGGLTPSPAAVDGRPDLTVLPGREWSEAWTWHEGRRGLLIAKYGHEGIEHSVLSVSRDLQFGGAGFCLYGEPSGARRLERGARFAFAPTRYIAFEGDWQAGHRAYKQFLRARGHGLPKGYNPPVNWNELFDVGWYHSDRKALFEHYTREALLAEAAKAKEVGAELLYLDPGWEVCEGTTLWDEERLGPAGEFVREVRRRFGLGVGFRTIGRVYRDEFPQRWYIQRAPAPEPYRPLRDRPFWEVCTLHRPWQREKLKRILKVVLAGMKFIMFDEFDWRGPCWAEHHGHPVPSTPDQHVRAIYGLIEAVHREYPDVLIEAHDPVWPWSQRYLPTYYRHGLPRAYDENWAFEYMWTPLKDLLSGKALCLYDYNLACDIPLYDHITMEDDNANCLAFWWYVSTVRHLGIGGVKGLNSPKPDRRRLSRYRRAMAEYLARKPLFVRGEFIGINEEAQLHVLPAEGRAVLVAFNLGARSRNRRLRVDLVAAGLDPGREYRVQGARSRRVGDRLEIALALGPHSARLVDVERL